MKIPSTIEAETPKVVINLVIVVLKGLTVIFTLRKVCFPMSSVRMKSILYIPELIPEKPDRVRFFGLKLRNSGSYCAFAPTAEIVAFLLTNG